MWSRFHEFRELPTCFQHDVSRLVLCQSKLFFGLLALKQTRDWRSRRYWTCIHRLWQARCSHDFLIYNHHYQNITLTHFAVFPQNTVRRSACRVSDPTPPYASAKERSPALFICGCPPIYWTRIRSHSMSGRCCAYCTTISCAVYDNRPRFSFHFKLSLALHRVHPTLTIENEPK